MCTDPWVPVGHSTRAPAKCNNLRGLYFQARPLREMLAYEYTTAPGVDLSRNVDFVAKFANMVIQLGAENVFALSVKVPVQGLLTEFELPDMGSTILVREAPTWLPEEGKQSTSTDWMATQDYSKYADGPGSVPGIAQLSCSTTRSGKHYQARCSTTRSGAHYSSCRTHKEADMAEIALGEAPVPVDSELYAIISQAMQMIDASA